MCARPVSGIWHSAYQKVCHLLYRSNYASCRTCRTAIGICHLLDGIISDNWMTSMDGLATGNFSLPSCFCWLASGRASVPWNFAPKPLVKLSSRGQPANPSLPGKMAVKTMCNDWVMFKYMSVNLKLITYIAWTALLTNRNLYAVFVNFDICSESFELIPH